ncbi:hypothetical protein GUJ93_ZPchr0004g39920 [Zizania palustris]|uniref:Uncharacterized protein n=1 Tax=Zizania palustris TaxID=103762 RepID=A0A8J5SQR0_ZIZPA|nr:hypothetical protein GUJ93_ZPchr0004g39920 [Zizania palustris]
MGSRCPRPWADPSEVPKLEQELVRQLHIPCLLRDLHDKPLLLLWKRHALACSNPGPLPGLNLGLKVEDPPLLLRNLPLASLKLSLQASELLSLGLNLLPALTLL